MKLIGGRCCQHKNIPSGAGARMINRRKIIQSGLAVVGATAFYPLIPASAVAPGYGIVGQSAPELEVDYWIDAEGESTGFSLGEHERKWVFLKCFQSWCPGCHSHGFPALKEISEALAGQTNVVFAGIQTVFEGHSVNTVDKVREIQLQYDLRMPMGHDPGARGVSPATMRDYRTGGTPWMILIDPGRRVVFNDYGIDVEKAIAFLRSQPA